MNISRNLSTSALALPILAACQTMSPPGETPTDGSVYTARGNEPGWILKMDGKIIDYQGDYGETKVRIAAPKARPSFNGMRYVTDRLTVDVTYASCTDDMSGKQFTDTVTVLTDGKQVKGCGGRALPPESLNNTTWTIVMIDQIPVLNGAFTEVRFAGGKVSGNAGCNQFSGSYTFDGNVLTFGQMITTRMMCPEKQMAQEAKFLALLGSPLTKRYSVNGNLIFANEKGNRATLKPII